MMNKEPLRHVLQGYLNGRNLEHALDALERLFEHRGLVILPLDPPADKELRLAVARTQIERNSDIMILNARSLLRAYVDEITTGTARKPSPSRVVWSALSVAMHHRLRDSHMASYPMTAPTVLGKPEVGDGAALITASHPVPPGFIDDDAAFNEVKPAPRAALAQETQQGNYAMGDRWRSRWRGR